MNYLIKLTLKNAFSYIKIIIRIYTVIHNVYTITMNNNKQQDVISPQQLAQIIRNKDKKYTHDGKDYILIIKQQSNNRCILLISDCSQTIWNRVLDLPFFINLRKSLHLNSSIDVFAQHYVSSLLSSSTIQKVKTSIKIHIELQIGEGLVMGCNTFIQSRVHYNNPDLFPNQLRKFIVYMLEIKCQQIQKMIEVSETTVKKKNQQEKNQKEKERSKPLFVADNKSQRILFKNRDLVNPQRKRRKKNGAKLGPGYQQTMFPLQSLQQNYKTSAKK